MYVHSAKPLDALVDDYFAGRDNIVQPGAGPLILFSALVEPMLEAMSEEMLKMLEAMNEEMLKWLWYAELTAD